MCNILLVIMSYLTIKNVSVQMKANNKQANPDEYLGK